MAITIDNSPPIRVVYTDTNGNSSFIASGTATLSNVASSATSVTLLAANTTRVGAFFFNDSTSVLYLKFGTTASATSFTVQLGAGAYYEMPAYALYTGIVTGIWASANGSARITELV